MTDYKLPRLNEQERAEVLKFAEFCKTSKGPLGIVCRYALTRINARPVQLPQGFSPGIGSIFDKDEPVMRRDSANGYWLHTSEVTKLLTDLGYEVKND